MNLLHEIGQHLSGIELLNAIVEADHRPGIGKTLDIRLASAEDGRVVLEASPDVNVYNPMGTVHGGFVATMLDFACGYAALSKLASGQSFTTIELKISYHRALMRETGTVRAEGKVITAGRRVAFTEARLIDADGKVYASATSSLLILSS
ncbi:PaaI family thioesterase [Malikia sp.]|uniref:PaaI family thioesterase n=1 Tax=Malikia sp. TaxID=2070706 RepID=UPI002633F13D|nr:PaaI family thioesterase [Malikia sp.]MDD2728444.1 PaaI family thioesterase [Malikia sp.]